MAHKNRISLIGNLQPVAISLLLVLATAGIAMAQNPVPLINEPLVPDSVGPGAAGFTLTVNGTGFVSGSTVNWNGRPLMTTFVSGTRLTASVPASDVSNAGTASVIVVNPTPGGGTSNLAFFETTISSRSIGLSVPAAFGVPGNSPGGIAVGDFNQDGKLDLAEANGVTGNDQLSVLLGNGDGSFQPAVNYSVGGDPRSVAVGDFNRDGKLDLVVGHSYTNDVSVLLGNGDGTFQPAVNHGVGTYPDSVAVGDFNRDGNLDLVVANAASNDISILLGNGDGTFQAAVNYAGGSAIGPLSVAVGDLNGDGKLDLAISNDGNVSALLGNGDGTLQPAVEWPGPGSNALAVGDFNGDGRLDVALSDGSDAAVSVLMQIPAVSLSQTSLTFADQVVGTRSSAQPVTITNTSGFSLDISSIALTGTNATDFSQSNTCGAGLPPRGKCTIIITFKPTQIGPRTASVTVTDNVAGSPQSITLSGIGVVSGPNAALSTTSLTFSTQLVGTTSAAQSVTLTNYGTSALNITKISFAGSDPGDFAETNTCESSVAPGANCTITVTFRPTGINTRGATLSITDNAPGSPHTISLSGTGTVVQLVPTSLSFCNLGCGPRTKSVTLTNIGRTTLHITSITITEDFSQTNNCGSSLRAGASCTFSVTVHPDFLYDYGSIDISDDGGGSPQYVSLGFVYKKP